MLQPQLQVHPLVIHRDGKERPLILQKILVKTKKLEISKNSCLNRRKMSKCLKRFGKIWNILMAYHHLPVSWIEILVAKTVFWWQIFSCYQHQFMISEQIPMKIKFCCSVNHVEIGDFAMVGYQFGAPMYKSERPYEGKEFQTQLLVLRFKIWDFERSVNPW